MMPTYRAVQATAPGALELVERARPVPAPREVLLAVEACGICGADAGDVNAVRDAPRVPGHEVVGRIIELGANVPAMWKLGMRVGVGRLGGHCNECSLCRQGFFQLCRHQHFVGSSCDGGYAEMMVARATGLVAVPDELASVDAAPLLCAGLATFNAMRKSGALAGDLVAIQGIGGLGHLALQYARKMYGAVLLLAAGATAWLANFIGGSLWLVLLAVLIAKANLEEQWLMARYPDYANYRRRTWRLVPWIH